MIATPEGLIRPEVDLLGEDGNAMAIMGRTSKALRRAGNPQSVIDAYMKDAMSGDYDHVLQVTMTYADVS